MTDSSLIHADLVIWWRAHIFFSPLAKIAPEEVKAQTRRNEDLNGDTDNEENNRRHKIIFRRRLESGRCSAG